MKDLIEFLVILVVPGWLVAAWRTLKSRHPERESDS